MRVINKTLKIDIYRCTGCRSCELACSYHFQRVFNPQIASIKVLRDYNNGEIVFSVSSTCNFCKDEEEMFCVKYCPTNCIRI